MLQLQCTEGEPFQFGAAKRARLRDACNRLQLQLRPSFRILFEDGGWLRIRGIVGTIDLNDGSLLEVAPKVDNDIDWIRSVLDLLVGSDRIDAAGERAAGLSPNRRNLLEVLASIYAARLERSFRRDGPIQILARRESTIPYLKGKLDSTQWLNHALWQPHRFPVTFNTFSVDHNFSRALALTAHIFSKVSQSTIVRGRLLTVARGLRPGCAEVPPYSGAETLRPLPPQWAGYKPAWSIAVATLSRRMLLGGRGLYQGISIAIEAWPLLERLLERSLAAASRMSSQTGAPFQVAPRANLDLLVEPTGWARRKKTVEPDGRLTAKGSTVATFEAKYSRVIDSDDWPSRDHVYQALAAAAACGSPLAVLVYPESFPPALWKVVGMSGRPDRLVAVGLGLFSYRAGEGELTRGRQLLELVTNTDAVATASHRSLGLSI